PVGADELVRFFGTDPLRPLGGLIQANGFLYGTTAGGAPGGTDGSGGGLDGSTVFKMDGSGALTVVVEFLGSFSNNTVYAETSLMQAADGTLYGTVTHGTGSAQFGGYVFSVDSNGALAFIAPIGFYAARGSALPA